MARRLCFMLSLLQAVVSEEWRADTPRDVTAQRGLCARIPCHYTYPSRLANQPREALWIKGENWDHPVITFHSRDRQREVPRFRHRTRLSGDLKDGSCSLIINDVTREDDGHYHFRIEFKKYKYSYFPASQLHVSDFTDKPSIFPAEMVAGKPGNIKCTFNTMCDGTEPNLTWVTPADVPPSVSSSVTQRGDTWTYTSVLTLTPELKHHGENLTCRVTYPSVSSEQTLTLTVQSTGQRSQGSLVILLAAAGVVLLIVSSAVTCLILKTRRRTGRPPRDAPRPVSEHNLGMTPTGERQKPNGRYETRQARSKTAQEKAQKNPQSTLKHQMNRHQADEIYENCQFNASSIYANL